jgi:peroxiredoxin
MATLQTAPKLGIAAPDFRLPATDGKLYSLKDVSGRNGVVVAFICNHCPYVKAVAERMVADAKTLMAEGVGFVAINANDTVAYPEDSLPNMKLFAARYGFPFPYLFDESQEIARAYDAVCTPEFYGVSNEGVLVYHGRLDEGRKGEPPPGARRELVEAMHMVAQTGTGPTQQFPSVGCSIKWRETA